MSNVLGMKDVKGVLVDLLEKLVSDDWEVWLKEVKKFLRKEPCWVNDEPDRVDILGLLSGGEIITIAPCDGTQTLQRENKTFSSIHSDFAPHVCDEKGNATRETTVEVREVEKSATYSQIFGSVGGKLDKLCLTQHQIKTFCHDQSQRLFTSYRSRIIFLFRLEERFYLVAHVSREHRGISLCVRRFECNREWNAGDGLRVVIPKF